MELIRKFFENVYNVQRLIEIGGLAGMFAVVFAETGLLIGFFLPGDSLLVAAGLFAARGNLNIVSLNLALMVAAIAGDATGYWIGYRAGKAIYDRPDSFFFRRKHLLAAHEFYEKHGGKTIIIARFMPIIRTFAPVVAGAGTMSYPRFASYNVIGGILWVASMTLTGYFLGQAIPDLEKHIHLVVAIVIFLSLLPGIIAYLRARLQSRRRGGPPPAALM
ncbi:MAG TPA: VTT domain-containing protein [Candidatus Polarisedimenticolia bacterium]|nr:VTT domain-containing protein [Candidatus Polarisedimenticolia bacterium]